MVRALLIAGLLACMLVGGTGPFTDSDASETDVIPSSSEQPHGAPSQEAQHRMLEQLGWDLADLPEVVVAPTPTWHVPWEHHPGRTVIGDLEDPGGIRGAGGHVCCDDPPNREYLRGIPLTPEAAREAGYVPGRDLMACDELTADDRPGQLCTV